MKVKMIRAKPVIIYITVVILSALFIFFGNLYATGSALFFTEGDEYTIIPAVVDEIVDKYTEELSYGNTTYIGFFATVKSGSYAGRVFAEQSMDDLLPLNLREVSVGDKVLLFLDETNSSPGSNAWGLYEYQRSDWLIWLGAAFAVLLILFGRRKGVSTLLSLAFTCLVIFLVLIPAILAGRNIYIITLVVSAYIIIMTLALVNGLNMKSLSAGIGCFTGLFIAGGLFMLADGILKLTGYTSTDSINLFYMELDLKGILFCGVVIGALGAVMDVAVSMAASLSEVRDTMQNPTFSALVRSGFNIGRDIMGTMTNTLILAYIGSSLPLVLLVVVYAVSPLELFNREMIVVEILTALTGSIGLLSAIPLTTFVSAAVYTRGKKRKTEWTTDFLTD